MPDRQQMLVALQAWGYVAAFAGSIVLLWYLLAGRKHRLLLRQRHRAVAWSGLEVCLALYLVFLWPLLGTQVLAATGFLTWVYGPGFPWTSPAEATGLAGAAATAAFAGPLPAAAAAATAARTALAANVAARMAAWSEVIAFPFRLVSILALLRLASGTRPYQLGLTLWRAPANVVAGCNGWFVLTPVVFGLYAVVFYLYARWVGSPPQEHPLTLTLSERPRAIEWAIIFFDALLSAPFLEELVFRGLIQPWAVNRSWGGTAAVVGALAVSLVSWKQTAAPALFVVAMLPGFFAIEFAAWRLLPEPNAARGIYGTALLFAAFHSGVWPTPIPLFVLALGLGYLAYRTQSLISPIVTHSLFNAVTCLMLVLNYLQ